jgi:hypothetical protein
MGTELDSLHRDVGYLMDRLAITDCIAMHARGCDRHDADLITAAYHPDGIDEHGRVTNLGVEYGDWANRTHSATSQVHTHNITTHTCEIDGDTAHAESYAIAILLSLDGRTAQVISGRYVDRLERRDGQWAIAVRRSTVEVMFLADASVLHVTATTCPTNGHCRSTRQPRSAGSTRRFRAYRRAPFAGRRRG